jgi:hypothetical protein
VLLRRACSGTEQHLLAQGRCPTTSTAFFIPSSPPSGTRASEGRLRVSIPTARLVFDERFVFNSHDRQVVGTRRVAAANYNDTDDDIKRNCIEFLAVGKLPEIIHSCARRWRWSSGHFKLSHLVSFSVASPLSKADIVCTAGKDRLRYLYIWKRTYHQCL